jgi:hypothetical protein
MADRSRLFLPEKTSSFRPNPGQQKAIRLLTGPQRHTLLAGGARSGKTFLLTKALVTRAINAPGSRHVILRHRANAVWASIGLDTLPKVMSVCFPGVPYKKGNPQSPYFVIEGSEIWLGGLDEQERVEKILGQEFSTIYLNECSEIRFTSVLVARTRLAQKIAVRESPDKFLTQRAYYDLNPAGSNHWTNREFGNGVDPVSGRPLANPDNFRRLFVNPEDNAENLTPDYLEELRNLPEKQRRRFYEGAYVSEIAGALWTYEELESWRVEESEIPTLTRIIVAVDPSGAAGKEDVRSDEIGIIVAGKGVDGRLYILADYSLRDGPDAWARAAIRAYHIYQADAIVGEVNFGKAMVEYTIRSIDPTVPIRQVTASRAKHVRAEPISNLYRQDKARHVGRFPNLEDQLVNFSVSGYIGEKSPDRADAMIWAATDLMLEAERPRLAFG